MVQHSRSRLAFALALVQRLGTPLGDVGRSAVRWGENRGTERRAVGVSRVAEVLQPDPSQFRLVIRKGGEPIERGSEFWGVRSLSPK
jgi:hypothetical protein